jgi:hypothetical protein
VGSREAGCSTNTKLGDLPGGAHGIFQGAPTSGGTQKHGGWLVWSITRTSECCGGLASRLAGWLTHTQSANQWGLGRKPSTAMFLVALGMCTTIPSRSLQAMIWQPSRDLQGGGQRRWRGRGGRWSVGGARARARGTRSSNGEGNREGEGGREGKEEGSGRMGEGDGK